MNVSSESMVFGELRVLADEVFRRGQMANANRPCSGDFDFGFARGVTIASRHLFGQVTVQGLGLLRTLTREHEASSRDRDGVRRGSGDFDRGVAEGISEAIGMVEAAYADVLAAEESVSDGWRRFPVSVRRAS